MQPSPCEHEFEHSRCDHLDARRPTTDDKLPAQPASFIGFMARRKISREVPRRPVVLVVAQCLSGGPASARL